MKYLKNIPLEMKEIIEYKEIDKAVEDTLIDLSSDLVKIENNYFLSILDEEGCSRMEAIMGLPDGTGDSLESRRTRLLVKANNALPYTIYNLKGKVRSFLGNDGFDINMNYGSYLLTITLFRENLDKLDKLRDEIIEMLPANIILILQIKYNPYSLFRGKKFSELSSFSYGYMKEHIFDGGIYGVND